MWATRRREGRGFKSRRVLRSVNSQPVTLVWALGDCANGSRLRSGRQQVYRGTKGPRTRTKSMSRGRRRLWRRFPGLVDATVTNRGAACDGSQFHVQKLRGTINLTACWGVSLQVLEPIICTTPHPSPAAERPCLYLTRTPFLRRQHVAQPARLHIKHFGAHGAEPRAHRVQGRCKKDIYRASVRRNMLPSRPRRPRPPGIAMQPC